MMMRKVVGAGLALVLMAGCVTSGKYEDSQNALGACRDDLNRCREGAGAQADACARTQRQQADEIARLTQEVDSCRKDAEALRGRAKADLVACVDARHGLETRLAAASRDLEQCQKGMQTAQADVKAMDARAAQLRQQLQGEIAAKNVEIEQLRDQLSVRVLDKILFRSGRADILPEGRAVLDKLAAVIGTTDDRIRVEGHTDIVPIGVSLKEKYPSNWELSTARASSVVGYFELRKGIDPLRMEAVGFSKYRPVAVGKTPEELQRNRRVEIILTAPKAR
jgi:chemotaxis protein MotB